MILQLAVFFFTTIFPHQINESIELIQCGCGVELIIQPLPGGKKCFYFVLNSPIVVYGVHFKFRFYF